MFWAKFSVANLDIEVANIDASKLIILNEALRDDDSVIHVEAAPWHEGYEQVFTKGELTIINGGTLNKNITLLYLLTTKNFGALIITATFVSLHEVDQIVSFSGFTVLVFNLNRVRVGFYNFTVVFGVDNLRQILGNLRIDTGRNNSCTWFNKWNCLFLHSAGHQRTVNTVFLDERHHRSSNTKNFFVSSIHVSNIGGWNLSWSKGFTSRNIFVNKAAIFVELCASICNNHVFFGGSINVNNFVSNFAVFYDTIRSFNETILIDTGVSCEVEHETHVGAFWCLNGTDAAIVSWVSITHIKASAFTRKTARTHAG